MFFPRASIFRYVRENIKAVKMHSRKFESLSIQVDWGSYYDFVKY